MTPEQFKKWRKRFFKSQRLCAEALGMSKESIYLYEKGERSDGTPVVVPKHVRLAMAAIALGHTDYEVPD